MNMSLFPGKRAPSACRGGNVFILNQDSKGIFRQISSGLGRHVNLVAGGLSSVCLVVDPPKAGPEKAGPEKGGPEKAAALGASAKGHAFSNEVLHREDETSHGLSQQRKRCGCAAATGCFTASPDCCTSYLHLWPQNDSETCCGVFAPLKISTSHSTGGAVQTDSILECFCAPQAGLKRQCDTETKTISPMQALLRLGNKGINSSLQLRFPWTSQNCCSVFACEKQMTSHLKSVAPSARVVQISVGSSHTLACDGAGSLYSWGDLLCAAGPDLQRQDVRPRPVSALRSRRVVSASAGDQYSLAVTDKGDVYSWGTSYLGQLGRALEEVTTAPRFVPGLMRTFITGICCNETHVLAHSLNGDCFTWGSNDCGQLGVGVRCAPQAHPQRIYFEPKTSSRPPYRRSPSTTRRQCGSSEGVHSSSARLEESLYQPAAAAQGALQAQHQTTAPCDPGYPLKLHTTEADSSCTTVTTACCGMREAFAFIVAVAAGWRHSLALTANGNVYSWGLNTVGQLGLGHCQTCYAPVLVPDYEDGMQVSRRSYVPSSDHKGRSSDGLSACTPLEAVSDECSHSSREILKCLRSECAQMCAFQGRVACHSRQFQTCLDEDEKRNSSATDRCEPCRNRGDADDQACSAAEACNRPREAQARENGKENSRRSVREPDEDSRPAHISTLRRVHEEAQSAQNASISRVAFQCGKMKFQDPTVTNNLASGSRTHATIMQICAGQLFSAFLSSDGCVYLAGQIPGAKQAANAARLVERTQCNYKSNSQGPSCNLVPATVPGLEDMVVSVIASSRYALVAFVPSQVLGVQPSLVPLPSPRGPSVSIRVTVTVSPDTSFPFMTLKYEADGLSEACTIRPCHNVNDRTERSTERDNGLVGNECSFFSSESGHSAVSVEGRHAEPLPYDCRAGKSGVRETDAHGGTTETGANHSAIFAQENRARPNQTSTASRDQAFEPCRGLLDSDTRSEKRQVQNYEKCDVLVRFRSIGSRLSSAFTTPRKCVVVRGRVVEKRADERKGVVEIDCTCPTLLHSRMDTSFQFDTDRADLPDDADNVLRGRENSTKSPSLMLSPLGTDGCLEGTDNLEGVHAHNASFLEANYFQPETPRAEAAIRAYHEAESSLRSQAVQMLPYAVEVSVDGGCCWSNAESNLRAASVLFARFPEELLAVCPNNITTKGGLSLSIFLDYIPSGIPQENIVVKFICVHKCRGSAPSSFCTLYFEDKLPPSTSSPSRTPTTAFPKSPSPNSQTDGYSDKVTFDMGISQRGGDGREPVRRAAPWNQSEANAGSGDRTNVEENAGLEPLMQYQQEPRHLSLFSFLKVGRVAGTTSSPATLPWGAGSGTQDVCYYLLVPARVGTQTCGSEIPHCRNTRRSAVQCSSPALDESVAADFDLFVDVALNGINFTGKPIAVRVLEPEIVKLVPDVGFSLCDTKVYIQVKDQCDSTETVVLLKHDDGYQQVVPVRTEAETRQLYFVMPQRRSLSSPPAEEGPGILEFVESSTGKDDFSGNLLLEGTTRKSSRSDIASGLPAKCSTTPGVEEPVNRNDAEMRTFPISVHLSFNGQAFSHSGKVFLQYESQPVVMGVLAYTIVEGGELFEADLENVIYPGTVIVVSLQSAVVTSSAQARLTVFRNNLTCSYPPLAQSAFTGVWDPESNTMQQEVKVAPPPGAVERVIILPAVVDMEPRRVVLQSDRLRSKKKNPVVRAVLPENGGKGKYTAGPAAGNGGAANAGAAAANKRNGIAAPEISTASSRCKNKGVAGLSEIPAVAAISGAGSATPAPGNKMPSKRHEKSGDLGSHADAEDEKTNNATLTVTVPAITLEPQHSDTSTVEGAVSALAEISLDGQHFVPIKQCPLLRLQLRCSTIETDLTFVSACKSAYERRLDAAAIDESMDIVSIYQGDLESDNQIHIYLRERICE